MYPSAQEALTEMGRIQIVAEFEDQARSDAIDYGYDEPRTERFMTVRGLMAQAAISEYGVTNVEEILGEAGLDASWARSKSVEEYLGQSFDYVITVCDEAGQECPVFPGVHQSLHWGYEDPAEAEGSEEERLAVFRRMFIQLGERIGAFIPLARKHRTEVDATTLARADPTVRYADPRDRRR